MQLINKNLAFSNKNDSYDDYLVFFNNTMNVYIYEVRNSILALSGHSQEKIISISNKSNLIMIISSSLAVFMNLNSYYTLRINSLKHKTNHLFFHIPPRVCWKYYSSCECFVKFLMNEEKGNN